jgi:hypothetical protein
VYSYADAGLLALLLASNTTPMLSVFRVSHALLLRVQLVSAIFLAVLLQFIGFSMLLPMGVFIEDKLLLRGES